MHEDTNGGGVYLTDAELRDRRALIDAELQAREAERTRAEREAQEAERERARAARARARQPLPSVGEWVQFEYTCCSRKTCKICKGTEYRHGPYWFHYFRKNGRQTSRYVGPVLDVRAADVLAAHEERQLAREQRTREVAAIRSGEDLAGLTAQEAYPDEFSEAEREDAARRKAKKLARDQRPAPTA